MPNVDFHSLPGKGDTLVITFNEMWNHYKDQRFWGERPLAKAGFPAFGITSDGPHWYPLHETIRALREPVKAARGYKNVVLYGYSMGAYAALKYSWLFEAPIVLAFSPQFSIDPNDVGPEDVRYNEFYNPSERVIKTEPADTNGGGYIFYDPIYPVDADHVRKIVAPQRRIPLPNCGHETIQCIRSASRLKSLILAAAEQDDEGVRQLIRGARRQNPFYAKYLLAKLLAKDKTAWAAAIATSLDKAISTSAETLAMAADAFKRVGDMASAADRYRRAFEISKNDKYNAWAMEAQALVPKPPEPAIHKGFIATLKSLGS